MQRYSKADSYPTLREIIDEHTKDLMFLLFSEPFVIWKQRDRYTQIRYKYICLAQEARDTFATYMNNWQSIADLNASAMDALILSCKPAIEAVVKDAISVGDYTLDSGTALQKCADIGCFKEFTGYLQELMDLQDQVLGQLSANDAYREYQRQTRAKWQPFVIGGTIGDAFKTEIKAGVLNTAEGAGIALLNSFLSSREKKRAEAALQQVFENQEMREKLLNSVLAGCFLCHTLVVDELITIEQSNDLGGMVPREHMVQADRMFNNLRELSLPLEKQQEFAFQILKLDPYSVPVFQDLIQRFPDAAQELLVLAAQFKVDCQMEERCLELLRSVVEIHLGTTPEALKECREIGLRFAETISFQVHSRSAEQCVNDWIKESVTKFAEEHIGDTLDELRTCTQQTEAFAQEIGYSLEVCPQAQQVLYDRCNELLCGYVRDHAGASPESLDQCRRQVDEKIEYLGFPPTSCERPYEILREKQIAVLQEFARAELGNTLEDALQCKQITEQKYLETAVPLPSLSSDPDPYENEVRIESDRQKTLRKILEPVYERICRLLSEECDKHLHAEEAEIQKTLQEIQQVMEQAGIPTRQMDAVTEPLEKRLAELDVQARTVTGCELKSREEARRIAELMEAHPDWFAEGRNYATQEECNAQIQQLRDANIPEPILSRLIDPINEQLRKIKAQENKRMLALAEDSTRFVTCGDYAWAAKTLETVPMDTAVRKHKQEALQQQETAFQEELTKAQGYQHFQDEHKLPGLKDALVVGGVGILVAIFLQKTPLLCIVVAVLAIIIPVCYVLQQITEGKKALEKLTRNGQYLLGYIQSDAVSIFDQKQSATNKPVSSGSVPMNSDAPQSRRVPVSSSDKYDYSEATSIQKRSIMRVILIILLVLVLILGVVFGNMYIQNQKKQYQPDLTGLEAEVSTTEVIQTEAPPVQTEAPTVPPTELPTDPPTEPPTEPQTEPPTDPPLTATVSNAYYAVNYDEVTFDLSVKNLASDSEAWLAVVPANTAQTYSASFSARILWNYLNECMDQKIREFSMSNVQNGDYELRVCDPIQKAVISSDPFTVKKKDAWKTVYLQKLNNMTPGDGLEERKYSLHDLNSDGIPELFISEGEYHTAQVDIYTYSNGKLILVDTVGEWGEVPVYQNYILSHYTSTRNGEYDIVITDSYHVFTLNVSSLNEVAVISKEETSNKTKYTYNGTSITASKYNSYLSQYHVSSASSIGRDYSILNSSAVETY